MSVEVVGSYPPLVRVPSGSYSLDHAVGNPYTAEWGIPLRSAYEIFGPPESGKTSLSYYLAGVPRPEGIVLMVTLEQADKEYIKGCVESTGFHGTVEISEIEDAKGNWLGHAKMITNTVNRFGRDENVVAMILDAVAAIVPAARDDDDSVIGTGFMTDRARFMGDLTSRVEAKLMNRRTPALFIALNHVSQSLDPFNKGPVTPGGVGLKFHSAVRLSLVRKEIFPKPGDTDESRTLKGFVAEGRVEKNRFGGSGRKFRIYIVPGRGVHTGMGAMFDCIHLKLGSRTDTGTIKLDGASMGRVGTFARYAFEGKDEKFTPFHEALFNFHPELEEEAVDG